MTNLKTYSRSQSLLQANKASKSRRKWHWESSDYLCQELAQEYDTVLLAFSLGKDSIAAYLQLKRFFKNVELYYYYIVPGIPFIDASLRYYEDTLKKEIKQVPSASFLENLNSFLFMSPNVATIFGDVANELFPFLSNDHAQMNNLIADYAKSLHNIPQTTIVADGNRADDNSIRRTSIIMHSPLIRSRNHFRPIYDWSKKEVMETIKESGVKLPIDYRIWGRSFDGIDYKFIKGLHDYLPESYNYLKQFYPLLDCELKKYDNFNKHKLLST